jgi:hypothetical protein
MASRRFPPVQTHHPVWRPRNSDKLPSPAYKSEANASAKPFPDENPVTLTAPPLPFRFLDLAAELRLAVYRKLIPNGWVISLKRSSFVTEQDDGLLEHGWEWSVWTTGEGEYGTRTLRLRSHRSTLSLFTVNKKVSHEAQGKKCLAGWSGY